MHHLIKRAGEFLAPFIAVSLLATLSAVPAGAVTESQVHAQFAALQNAVQSTQAYAGITDSEASALQSALQGESSAVANRNSSQESTYASDIANDSPTTYNDLQSTLAWMNSTTYEYQLLVSEESSSQYARGEFPEATVLDNEALAAYGGAKSYVAAASSLPSGGNGLFGLLCATIAIIGYAGAPDSAGLSEAAAQALQSAIQLTGVGCAIAAL